MIRLALLLVLAADGGYDAPWIEARDGGRVVCMTEATSVLVAQGAVFTETAHEKEHAALIAADPPFVKIAIGVLVGVAAGVGLTVAVGCGTGHCR